MATGTDSTSWLEKSLAVSMLNELPSSSKQRQENNGDLEPPATSAAVRIRKAKRRSRKKPTSEPALPQYRSAFLPAKKSKVRSEIETLRAKKDKDWVKQNLKYLQNAKRHSIGTQNAALKIAKVLEADHQAQSSWRRMAKKERKIPTQNSVFTEEDFQRWSEDMAAEAAMAKKKKRLQV